MAETNTAPSPSFSGINFNPAFFNTSTGLTLSQADSLYLNKSVADTANVLETFTVGISANALQATTATISSLSVLGVMTSNFVDSLSAGALQLGYTNATSVLATQPLVIQHNLTLATAPSLPTSNQLGYTYAIYTNTTATTTLSANIVTNIGPGVSIPIGTYIVSFSGGGGT